ncbi:MAG: 30S ribosome-binding factor RbfA [Pirellulaceae bacterium]
MTSRRVLKSAEAIREVVSTAILMELKDPRVQDVTVTYVEVSPDLRQAKVHVSVMGDEAKQKLSLRGLNSAAGFLQMKIAKRIDTRYTPKLQFVLDQGVKHSIEVSRILSELFPHGAPPPDADGQARDEASPDDGTLLDEADLGEADLDEADLDEADLDVADSGEGGEDAGREEEGSDEDNSRDDMER